MDLYTESSSCVRCVFSVSLHLKRVGDHDCNEPHGGTDTPCRSYGPPSMKGTGCVDDS